MAPKEMKELVEDGTAVIVLRKQAKCSIMYIHIIPLNNFMVCDTYIITLNSIHSVDISDGATQMYKLLCCLLDVHNQSRHVNAEILASPPPPPPKNTSGKVRIEGEVFRSLLVD